MSKSSKKSGKSSKTNELSYIEENTKIHYELDVREIINQYNPSKNKTSNIMNKFEKPAVLGKRATQIAYGAEALFDVPATMYKVVEIAEEELRLKKTPYILERDLGNGKIEFWKISDMIIF